MKDVEEVRAYYRALLPYYDAALEGRGDLPFWESMARRWSATRILELGCGTGRVTAVLSRHASTTAVDLLIEMLDRARRRAPKASLVVADLRRFAFASAFDLVVLADDPMAHLTSSEERTAVVRSIADHLMPGGRLVLEGLVRPSRERLVVPARDVFRDGQKLFAVEELWEPSGDHSIWTATYRYKEESATTEVTAVLRSWTLADVDRLGNAGLLVETLWGDFNGRPFCNTSERMLIVARRGERQPVPGPRKVAPP
jgi:SAM-dependent methyltransferase